MDAKLKTTLLETKQALEDLFVNKKLPEDAYYKSLVCVAYEYAAEGVFSEAVAILRTMPPEYFQKTIETQMAADPDFLDAATELATSLVEQGIVELGWPNLPPPADA